jgi:pSer/pThr/pTyr-binding forkhead associated (FHA) protein
MKHTLRYRQQDLELTEGRFLIGRAASCQLSLDDPLVSRNHAVISVSAAGVTIEDLGSRNGVTVNGERIAGVHEVKHGDQIAIGSQALVYLVRRDVPADTLVQSSSQRVQAFGLLGVLADKALALGRGDEAERLLGEQLNTVLAEVESGRPVPDDAVDRATEYALKLAMATGSGAWVDYIFRVYTAAQRPCPAAVVDELYTVLRKVQKVSLGALRDYVAVLRERSGSLGPAERFLVSRIEGLERLASAM